MNAAQLINQTSGIVEYYTPSEITVAARRTMGGIDLDPASSAAANERVMATDFFDEDRNGLAHPWNGRVFLNHPFGRIPNPLWINKLEIEFSNRNVYEACCITFACTSEKWFQPLLQRPQCFLSPRTNYLLPDGSTLKGVTKGSVVTYYGPHVQRFAECFRLLGTIKVGFPLKLNN